MTEFSEKIKQWVTIDSQLKLIHEKTKEIRNKKTLLLEEISQYVLQNNIKYKTIEISDGNLKFYEKKEYSNLTYSYIEECLQELIKDEEQIDFVMNYLRDHREVKTSIDIRRKKNIVSK